jgi:hypothetical protein
MLLIPGGVRARFPRVARLSSSAPTMLVQVEKQVSLAAPSIATI